MLSDSKWDYQFGLTYSVTLSSEDLETSLVVRNTGSRTYEFQVLFHSYLKVEVRFPHHHIFDHSDPIKPEDGNWD